jgi:hypothetical protein
LANRRVSDEVKQIRLGAEPNVLATADGYLLAWRLAHQGKLSISTAALPSPSGAFSPESLVVVDGLGGDQSGDFDIAVGEKDFYAIHTQRDSKSTVWTLWGVLLRRDCNAILRSPEVLAESPNIASPRVVWDGRHYVAFFESHDKGSGATRVVRIDRESDPASGEKRAVSLRPGQLSYALSSGGSGQTLVGAIRPTVWEGGRSYGQARMFILQSD